MLVTFWNKLCAKQCIYSNIFFKVIEFDKVTGKYYPILYLNDYWNLHEDYMPINDTLTHVNLSLTFSHLQLWKWQLYLSQSQQVKNSWYNGLLAEDSNDEDQDTIKRTLLETNPYLLVLTVIITLVHNVFEFLAFKNGKIFLKLKNKGCSWFYPSKQFRRVSYPVYLGPFFHIFYFFFVDFSD